MKNKILIFIPLLLLACIESHSDRMPLSIKRSIPDTISVFENGGSIPWKELVKKIDVVPLEFTLHSSISNISSIFVDDNIYVFSMPNQLLVFSSEGKFLYQVGEKGKGPGEYNIIYDFQIDSLRNTYITDIGHIRKYNPEGQWIKDISLGNISKEFRYIDASCVFSEHKFYAWKNNEPSNLKKPLNDYFLYRVQGEGPIIKEAIKAITYSPTIIPRFTPTDGGNFFVAPTWYDNNIYLIMPDSIQSRYFIDFGKNGLDDEILSKTKNKSWKEILKLTKGKCCRIQNFWGQGGYLFFNFVDQFGKMAFSFYKKETKKVYTSSYKGSHLFNIPIRVRCFERNRNVLIASFEPYMLLNQDVGLDDDLKKLMSENDFRILKNLKEMDNTVILRLKLK